MNMLFLIVFSVEPFIIIGVSVVLNIHPLISTSDTSLNITPLLNVQFVNLIPDSFNIT